MPGSAGAAISRMNVKPRELNQGGTSTTETIFTSDGTIPVICPLPPLQLTGDAGATTGGASMFRVRAYGRVTTAGAYTFAVRLYYGTSATVASNTAISLAQSASVSTISTNWRIEADCVYDGSSGRLIVNSAKTAIHTTTCEAGASITGVTSNNLTQQGFVVSATFGTGSATNAAYLDGFEILL
jgi:hypothetical protein